MRSISFLLAFVALFFAPKIEAQNAASTEPIFVRHSFFKGAMVSQGGSEHRVGGFYRGLKTPLAAVPESKKLSKKARRQQLLGLGLDAVALGLLFGSMSAAPEVSGDEKAEAKSLGLLGGSLVALTGTVILLRKSGKNIDAAVEAHNRAVKKK